MISSDTVRRIQKDYPLCFRCGNGVGLQVHHAIYKRNAKFAKWLDMEQNLVMLCADCNAGSGKGYVQSWFFRCLAWSDKLEKGYDMIAWNDSIPQKVKDHFIYIGSDKRFKDV
jgi:5-methylcytosine-specific restriction endonuclease McrA